VPFPGETLYRRLAHRGVAGTSIYDSQPGAEDGISADHSAGVDLIPCFRISHGLGRPGRSDRVTLITADGADDEERRVNHAFYGGGEIPGNIPIGMVALTEFTDRAYLWTDSKKKTLERANETTGKRWFVELDTRETTRMLKFPSGEMPTEVAESVSFCQGLESSGVAQSFLDEVGFETDLSDKGYILYDPEMLQVDEENPQGFEIPGIDEEAEEIPIRQFKSPDGLPIDGLPETGGVVKIDDELIAYRELDTSGGYLLGCERGILGTTPAYHSVPSRIIPMAGIVVTKLEGALSATAAEIPVSDASEFPRAGYLRIGEELIGYTSRTDSSFTMPARRSAIDEETSSLDPEEEDVDAASGLFRARFGTEAREHDDEAIVYAMPFRYWDRYAKYADDAEMSHFQVQKHVPGAVWKRIAWTEFLVPNVDIALLVRFEGGPTWDSDRVIELGTDPMPREDRASYLYLIKEPHEANRLNVRSDRIQIRVLFPYLLGAYDRSVEPMPDEWKDTPRLKALRIEYVAPSTVLYHEEIR
jgi:hypothetical protein